MSRSVLVRAMAIVAALPLVAAAEFESSSPPPSTKPREAARPWDLSIRPFIGYDDNVQLVPDMTIFVGDTSSFLGGLAIDGSYRVFEDEHWTLAAAASLQNVWYADEQQMQVPGVNDDHDDYDLLAVHPTATVGYRDVVAGTPVRFGASYAFRFEDGDVHAMGLEAHTLGLSASADVCRGLAVTLAWAHEWNAFDVRFPNEGLNGRDAELDRVDLTARYRFDRNRRSITIGYGFARNDADGDNFDYDAHQLSAKASSQLVGSLWGELRFSARFADYDGPGFAFIPDRRNRQRVYDYGAGLIWVFGRHLSADVFYQRQDIDAGSASFRSDRDQVGGGVTFRF